MLKRIYAILPPNGRRRVPLYLFLVAALSVAQAGAYLLIVPIFQSVFPDDPAGSWPWIALLAGVVAAIAATNYAQSMVGFGIALDMTGDIQERIGEHIRQLPLGWFTKERSGAVSQLVFTNLRDVIGVFAHLFVPMATGIAVPVLVAIGMLAIEPLIAVTMLIAVPALALVSQWSHRLYGRANARTDAAAVETNNRVLEFAQLQPMLRAHSGHDASMRDITRAFEEQYRTGKSTVFAAIQGLIVFGSLTQLVFVSIIYVIVSLAAGGSVSAAGAIALIAVAGRFIAPLNEAAEMGTAVKGASQSATKLQEFLETPTLPEPANSATPGAPGVSFREVSFEYEPGAPVLRTLSFDAPAGTTTALVGPSGGGKSSVLKLIARFADARSGEILVAGSPIEDYRSEELFRNISFVFQDVYLFDNTIMENIRVGNVDASDEEVLRVARLARVTEIVDRLPNGWSSRVGESGAALSGGERQRVSIARALLKDAPIVLLDEATSSLDPVNEAAVVAGVRELTEGKTVIMVAHRLNTIRHADRILFLERGAIVEQGTHEELIALSGRYSDFWRGRSAGAGWRLTRGSAKV